LRQEPGGRIGILSDNPRAAEAITDALGRLVAPLRGRIGIGSTDLSTVSDEVGGKRIAYIGPGVYLARSPLRESLLYSLRRPPLVGEPLAEDDPFDAEEAKNVGNLALSPRADWIDLNAAGVASNAELNIRLLELLHLCGLFEDVFEFGLSMRIDPEKQPKLAMKVVQARAVLRFWIEGQLHDDLVEPFDDALYTTEASIASNLVFAASETEAAQEKFLLDPAALRILEELGVDDDLVQIGARITDMLADLIDAAGDDIAILRDIPLIRTEELAEISKISTDLARWTKTVSGRMILMRLALRYIEPRDRMGLLGDAQRDRLLEARARLQSEMNDEIAAKFSLYEIDDYTPGATILDNILFGKVRIETANSRQRIRTVILEMLAGLEMNDEIALAGLSKDIGNGGGDLSDAQRQQVALVRALLKRPDIMVLNRAFDPLGEDGERELLEAILGELDGWAPHQTTLIATLSRPSLADLFERVITVRDGRLVD